MALVSGMLNLGKAKQSRVGIVTDEAKQHQHHKKKHNVVTAAPTQHIEQDNEMPIATAPQQPERKSAWEAPPYDGEATVAWSPDTSDGNAAFVTFIGNEKYIDGALVLGYSLQQHSKYIKLKDGDGNRRCFSAILMSPDVSSNGKKRLQRVFDNVIQIKNGDSLARKISGTTWGTTFDKFHLYNLTEYDVIAFLDADIVILRNPDSIFSIELPKDKHWIAAVPGHSSRGYFHTGAMVIRPSSKLLDELLNFYNTERNSKEDKYKFRSTNGRDGLVMRYFIDARVVFLGNRYSAQQVTADWVVGLHLSGTWKPWYNRWGDRSELKAVHESLRSSEHFGKGHSKWWAAYELLHREYFTSDDDSEEWTQKWGAETSPNTHVWMLRDTEWEYTQKFGEYREAAFKESHGDTLPPLPTPKKKKKKKHHHHHHHKENSEED